ncbi:MAG: hypothetical protein HY529_06060 [Chloroflexi bacterium]|nr:hypothetical protein [Chloroflexota bacterium]
MKLILLLLATVIIMLGIIGTSSAAYFSDSEISNNNHLTAAEQVTVTLIGDGFEGNPWTTNWDGNGATNWLQKLNDGHTGTYAAECKKGNNGSFTSDSLNASTATMIKVSFWFKPTSLAAGDMLVQIYNGSTYNTWYDLVNYPTFRDNTWSYFSENITDPQYFKGTFRLRLNGSALKATGKLFDLDDVLIQRKNWP